MNRRNIIKSLCAAPLMAVPTFDSQRNIRDAYFDGIKDDVKNTLERKSTTEFWLDRSDPDAIKFLKNQLKGEEFLNIEIEYLGLNTDNEIALVKLPNKSKKYKIAVIVHEFKYQDKSEFAYKHINDRLESSAKCIYEYRMFI